MKILICYASTEGQTRKICRFVADRLFALGHAVELISAEAASEPFPDADGAILAGSVHVGQVQADLAEVAAAQHDWLNQRSSLFLQVSLAATGTDPKELAELDRIARSFCMQAGWLPQATHHVAGAFKFPQYDFFKAWAMRWIAHSKGEDVDPHGEREYTDWLQLERIVTDWAARLDGPA